MIILPRTADVPNPKGRGFGAVIDDLPLRLAPSARQPVRVQSARAQAQQAGTSEVADEFTSDTGKTYALGDASGGEGLLERHRRNRQDSDPIRYWDSEGLDIRRAEFGTTERITLLPSTEAAPVVAVLTNLDGIVSDGTVVHAYTSTVAAVQRITTIGGTPGESSLATTAAPTSITRLAGDVYVAAGGVVQRSAGGTAAYATTYNTGTTTRVWGVAARLVVATGTDGRELRELLDPLNLATGTTLLRTLPAGATWSAVAQSDGGILAATGDTIYAFAPDETGVLALIGQSVFQNEQITSIGYSQGVVLVGTTSATVGRLWVTALANGALAGSVVREWPHARGPLHFTVERESVYTAIPRLDAGGTYTTHLDVWRYDVVNGAVHRHLVVRDATIVGAATTTINVGLTLVAGKLLIAARNTATGLSRFYRPAAMLEATGWLITPLADFFTRELKTWTNASVQVGVDAPVGSTVSVLFATETEALNDAYSGAWRRVSKSPLSRESIPIIGVESAQLAGQVRLFRSEDGLASPSLESVAFRGLLASTDILVTLPVVVSDIIEQPYKRPIRVPGLGAAILAELVALERNSVALKVFTPALTLRGQVETVDATSPLRARRGSGAQICEVVIRGRRVGLTGQSQEEGPIGSYPSGLSPAGGSL